MWLNFGYMTKYMMKISFSSYLHILLIINSSETTQASVFVFVNKAYFQYQSVYYT